MFSGRSLARSGKADICVGLFFIPQERPVFKKTCVQNPIQVFPVGSVHYSFDRTR